jgi:group I intron endonuclease
MSESKYIYIVYKTTNLVNQKIYIGAHKQDFFLPIIFDGYLGSGLMLKRAIKKYSEENFRRETLFVYYTPEEAYDKEVEIVDEEFISRKDTYNIVCGGQGNRGFSHSGESKRKISESMKGNKNAMYGKKRRNYTQKTITCPHCGKTGGQGGMKRYHFDKCKNNSSNK